MSIVIINAGAVGFVIGDTAGPPLRREYLRSLDVNAKDGYGMVTWTTDVTLAKRFTDMYGALEEWRSQSAVMPLRDDGKPNRPLTAYSITFEEISDE